MISYLQAVDVIRTFAINHLQIQRFGFEFREQMPNIVTTEESFPYLFVVPVGSNSLQNVREIDFDVYCVDKYQSERNNVPYIISDTDLILADLTLWLEEGQDDIEVVRSYSITPINNDLLDYVGGHVMRLRVQVDRIALCEIPFDGDTPVPPVCPSGFVRNSDNTYTEIVLSGGTLVLPDITVTDSDGSTFTQPAVTNVVCTFNPPCEDATYSITDTDDNILYSGSIPSGGNLDQVIQDSTYLVEYVNGTPIESGNILAEGSLLVQVPNPIVCADAIVNVNSVFFSNVPSGGTENIIVRQSTGSTQVGSIQGQYFRIADSTAVLKTTSNVTLSTTSIKAEDSEDIVAPDTSIEVNGVAEGSVVAGSSVDIQLSDSLGVVTPISVTQVGNDFAVLLPDAPPSGFTDIRITKSGVTTSYADYDAGYYQRGRDASFFKLQSNNPYGNIWRFTGIGGGYYDHDTSQYKDVNGNVTTIGVAYPDNIMIDWNNRNAFGVMLWRFTINPININWDDSRTGCFGLTIGGLSNWELPESVEIDSLRNWGLANHLGWLPINLATALWTANTSPSNTSLAFYRNGSTYAVVAKTSSTNLRYIPCRWTLLTEIGL
jgi:hypothetical protein